MSEQLTHQLEPIAEPSCVLGSTSSFGLLSKWAKVTHPNEEYVASKIQEAHKVVSL